MLAKNETAVADPLRRIVISDEPTETRYINTKRNIIEIDENILELRVRDYETVINAMTKWQTPFGIFVTIIVAIYTADFANDCVLYGFVFSAGASCFWTVYSMWKAFQARNKVKTPKTFVESCRGNPTNKTS